MKIVAYGHLYEFVENSLETYLRKNYLSQIVTKAQHEYDQWVSLEGTENFEDEYFGGGICHLIADSWASMFNSNSQLDAKTITYDDEVHVATLVRWAKDESSDAFNFVTVDIPWRRYETGGGYSFEPIPNVKLDESDVIFTTSSTSLDNWEAI